MMEEIISRVAERLRLMVLPVVREVMEREQREERRRRGRRVEAKRPRRPSRDWLLLMGRLISDPDVRLLEAPSREDMKSMISQR